ncbi:hypothetical protein Taro_009801 [Colocasia esculenta]|uniref:Uncharacterized protein n=1 Tax=Colocasia esculenta TaxID=4460 RepID=A0A843U1Y4_COLES|nr:hypothetical protein [Colocasia esculenta]
MVEIRPPRSHLWGSTSQSRSHGRKVQLPLHVKRSSNCGDQLNTTTCEPHGHRPMPDTSGDPGLGSLG